MCWKSYLESARSRAEADRAECRRKGFVFINFLIDSWPGREGISVYHQVDVPHPISSYGFLHEMRNSRSASLDFKLAQMRFTPRGRR